MSFTETADNEVIEVISRADRRRAAYAAAHKRQLAKKENERRNRIDGAAITRRAQLLRQAKAEVRRAEREAKRAEIAKTEGVSPKRVILVSDGYVVRKPKAAKLPKRDTPKWKRIKAARAAKA